MQTPSPDTAAHTATPAPSPDGSHCPQPLWPEAELIALAVRALRGMSINARIAWPEAGAASALHHQFWKGQLDCITMLARGDAAFLAQRDSVAENSSGQLLAGLRHLAANTEQLAAAQISQLLATQLVDIAPEHIPQLHVAAAQDLQNIPAAVLSPMREYVAALRSISNHFSQVHTPSMPEAPANSTTPIPGQFWPEQHGFYAGIMPALAGLPAYHLILDPTDLIAADGSAEHEWGEYGKKIAGADSLTDGLANTRAMFGDGSPVAILTASASSANPSTGASAPFIPSKREMALIVATCSEHMTAGELYWTSSQYSAIVAWFQSFNYGHSLWLTKNDSLRVRPVRRLPL